MAHIVLEMTAMGGIADERCYACTVPFHRGETMHAVEYENGDRAGWICDACIISWKKNDSPPEAPK